MTAKANNGAGQTDGATVTTGNSGASGDAFNAVQIDAGAALTYSIERLMGTESRTFKIVGGATAASKVYAMWTDTASGSARFAFWYQLDGAPGAAWQGPISLLSAASSSVVRLQEGTGRTLTVQGPAAQLGVASVALSADTAYWISGTVSGVGTGGTCTVNADIFDATGTLLDSIGGTGAAGANQIDRGRIGKNSSVASLNRWVAALQMEIGSSTPYTFPAATTNAPAAEATGTGSAAAPAGSVAVFPAEAAGVGDAVFDVAGGGIDVTLTATNPVLGTGAAFDPSVSVSTVATGLAGTASGDGQAFDVTVQDTQVFPAEAAGTGAAPDPIVGIFIPPPSLFRFDSPTVSYLERPFGSAWDLPRGPIVERVVGLTVLRVAGQWQALPSTSAADEAAADRLYYGGHSYVLDAAAAAELVDAGYGANLTPIPS